MIKNLFLFIWGIFFLGSLTEAQSETWEKHLFKSYGLEFQTPSDWQVTINDSSRQTYIECYSPDNQMYFFITSAENEKKSDREVVLSYLKVTYNNCEFFREDKIKVNNVEFLFSSGINRLEDVQTYIKLGVGTYKKKIYMVDSGYNHVNSDESERLLNLIIGSIKVN